MNTTPAPYSTVALPDGIVVGGPWPETFVSWPNGNGRRATKLEHDLFQALEAMNAENANLRGLLARASDYVPKPTTMHPRQPLHYAIKDALKS